MSKPDQSEVNTLGFASTTMELQKNFKQVEEIMQILPSLMSIWIWIPST